MIPNSNEYLCFTLEFSIHLYAFKLGVLNGWLPATPPIIKYRIIYVHMWLLGGFFFFFPFFNKRRAPRLSLDFSKGSLIQNRSRPRSSHSLGCCVTFRHISFIVTCMKLWLFLMFHLYLTLSVLFRSAGQDIADSPRAAGVPTHKQTVCQKKT